MSRKLTIEQITEIFDKFGLEILDDKSSGIDHKYTLRDKDGYLYSRSPHSAQASLKRNKTNNGHIFSTKNPFFYDNMLHYIENNVKNGTTLLTKKEEIDNIDQHLSFKCGECGREYKSIWHTFVNVNDKVCNFCFNQKRAKGEMPNNHRDTNKFHEAARKNGLLILNGPDIKYHQGIRVQDTDGYKGIMQPQSILKNSSFERFSTRNPYTIDNIRLFAFKRDWDCVVYDQEYKGDKSPLRMMCSCGNDFLVDANHFVAGKYRCNECRMKQSAIAASVELWLNQNSVAYIKEKTFDGCAYKKVLPFDFYLPDYDACIEVDGIGHYRPVAFSGDKELAKSNYEIRVLTDGIKTEYCKNNNIPLLRLPFWEIEDGETYKTRLEQFLSNKSNDLIK